MTHMKLQETLWQESTACLLIGVHWIFNIGIILKLAVALQVKSFRLSCREQLCHQVPK